MTNGAAIGYMIMAAKEIGLDLDTIKHLDSKMYSVMDRYTEEEAEKEYQNT